MTAFDSEYDGIAVSGLDESCISQFIRDHPIRGNQDINYQNRNKLLTPSAFIERIRERWEKT